MLMKCNEKYLLAIFPKIQDVDEIHNNSHRFMFERFYGVIVKEGDLTMHYINF